MDKKEESMLRRLFAIIPLAAAVQAHAAEAGKIIFSAGATQVAQMTGAEGKAVQEGDLLSTGADGFLYVKTIDNGLFILRPNTRARIAAYHVDTANPANSRFKLELISGVARSKSGDAVKQARQNFRFNTPVAAIGVRGTDFTVYHDRDTSRVAVLTGGIVVSGFGGACRPEGGGPCEGATSRELSAAQRGQLLQIRRGQAAPQMLSGSTGPDQVSPPRADEPLARSGVLDPVLDAKKGNVLSQIAPPTAVTPPAAPAAPAAPVATPPAAVVPAAPEPERALEWGRWQPLLGAPATAAIEGPAGAERILGANFVLFRTAGQGYVAPERGSVGFALKGGEAYILDDDPGKTALAAQLQNGQLNVDFGKRSFVTSFDLVGGGAAYKLMADGEVTTDGRFGNTAYTRPQTNNMAVDGFLSNADKGSAGYLFRARLDDTHSANGVTYWTRH
jgi:hypothetical protein